MPRQWRCTTRADVDNLLESALARSADVTLMAVRRRYHLCTQTAATRSKRKRTPCTRRTAACLRHTLWNRTAACRSRCSLSRMRLLTSLRLAARCRTIDCIMVAPHRRMGVGRALLAHLIYTVREDPDFHDIDRLELHVHASNEDALAFYSASGFEDVHELQNYYPRLVPPHARLLRLRV